MSGVAKLAHALLERAVHAFQIVPPEERGSSLAALDDFLAAPGASRFVAAIRVLGAASREARLRHLRTDSAGRSHQRGLAALAAVPRLDPALLEALRSLPTDEQAGLRLGALAALASAHQELAGCVEGARQAMLRDLQAATPAPPARPRRARQPRA